MVGLGTLMAFITLWGALLWWRKRSLPDARWFLRSLVIAAPAGMLAIEAGWTVTEVGRQPWIIYNVMRTSSSHADAGIAIPFVAFPSSMSSSQ
jgi:cytochrome d ubiquinol oxidase subunit I